MQTAKFSLRGFAPGWGAAVMGTGALAIALWALADRTSLGELVQPVIWALFGLTLASGVVVLALTLLRWATNWSEALADLRHAVRGGMAATMPGAILVVAMALGRIGADRWGLEAVRGTVLVLTLIGGLIAIVFGLMFLTSIFASGTTKPAMITGAWFIPPVVTVLIPAALAPMIAPDWTGSPIDRELLGISWATLGIGAMLYVVITAVLFFRSATNPLPTAGLAPTLIIGMGPAGLIGLDLAILTQAAERLGTLDGQAVGLAAAAGLAFWGFGLWWALAAIIVMFRGYPKIPFGLSWWGFTFPLGAWVTAGFVLGHLAEVAVVIVISNFGLLMLAAVWVVTAIRTIAGIVNRTIWTT